MKGVHSSSEIHNGKLREYQPPPLLPPAQRQRAFMEKGREGSSVRGKPDSVKGRKVKKKELMGKHLMEVRGACRKLIKSMGKQKLGMSPLLSKRAGRKETSTEFFLCCTLCKLFHTCCSNCFLKQPSK